MADAPEYTPDPAGYDPDEQTPNPDTTPQGDDAPEESPDESATIEDPGFDASELNRKLDAISEAIGVISKAIAQLMTSGTTPDTTPAPEDVDDNPHEGVKDFEDLDL